MAAKSSFCSRETFYGHKTNIEQRENKNNAWVMTTVNMKSYFQHFQLFSAEFKHLNWAQLHDADSDPHWVGATDQRRRASSSASAVDLEEIIKLVVANMNETLHLKVNVHCMRCTCITADQYDYHVRGYEKGCMM